MKQYKISVSWKGQVLDSIIMGLCKTQQTSRAIDFLAYMVENGCKPTEATYNILVKGITSEGYQRRLRSCGVNCIPKDL